MKRDGLSQLSYEAEVAKVEDELLQKILKFAKRNDLEVGEGLVDEVHLMAAYSVRQAALNGESVKKTDKDILSLVVEYAKIDPAILIVPSPDPKEKSFTLGASLSGLICALYETQFKSEPKHRRLEGLQPQDLVVA